MEQTPDNEDHVEINLSFAEMLAKFSKGRIIGMSASASYINPPYPKLPLDAATQVKLFVVAGLMVTLSSAPGTISVDQTIPFRKLPEPSLQWLEKAGVYARRSFAPLAADYIHLFGGDQRLLDREPKNVGRFYGLLIHCLLVEVQLLVNSQYFHGLGLVTQPIPLWWWNELVPSAEQADATQMKLLDLNNVTLLELYGRIFYEYYLVMVRAQWDKIIRLTCLFFGLRPNEDSSQAGLSALGEHLKRNKDSLHPSCMYHLKIFQDIATERLKKQGGWLVPNRDNLLHFVGEHSVGVIPHKKSEQTTTELWEQVKNEHNWLREAMLAMLIAFLTATAKLT
jgi:hypothetical protein